MSSACAGVPRCRYDQLMRIGWKIFLPLSLVWVALVSDVMLALTDAAHPSRGSSRLALPASGEKAATGVYFGIM